MEVADASQATEVALSFLKKSYPFAWPLKTLKEQDTWLVEVDIGLFERRIARVKVDAKTGGILEYVLGA